MIKATVAILLVVAGYISLTCQYFSPTMLPRTAGSIPTRLVVFADNVTAGTEETLRHNAFELELYTVDLARAYVQTNCGFMLEAYDELLPLAFKSDLFRYCALWAGGGVYLDFDRAIVADVITQLAPIAGNLLLIRDMMPVKKCFTSKDTGAWQGLLIAREPKSPELLCAMKGAAAAITAHKTFSDRLELTGPKRLASCLTATSDATYIGYVEIGESTDIKLNNHEVVIKQAKVTRSAPHWATYGDSYYSTQ